MARVSERTIALVTFDSAGGAQEATVTSEHGWPTTARDLAVGPKDPMIRQPQDM